MKKLALTVVIAFGFVFFFFGLIDGDTLLMLMSWYAWLFGLMRLSNE